MGTGISSCGSLILNQFYERHSDKLMQRTQNRPLPEGRISPFYANILGTFLSVGGILLIENFVNSLTAILTFITWILYVMLYTPIKKLTWWNTPIGALSGAVLPMIGWAARTNEIGMEAWFLALVLFIWQHPHFYSIALIHKDDYQAGGHKMLPVVDKNGIRTYRQTTYYSVLLVPVSCLPYFLGDYGLIYLLGSLSASLMLLFAAILFVREKSKKAAKFLLRVNLMYLPVLLLTAYLDSI